MRTVIDLEQLVRIKSEELDTFYTNHKGDQIDERGAPIFKMDSAQHEEGMRRNQELIELSTELESARAQDIYLGNQQRLAETNEINRKGGRPVNGEVAASTLSASYTARNRAVEGYKNLGEQFTDSLAFKMRQGNHVTVEIPDADFKTLMSDAQGFAPPNNRGPVVVLSAQRIPVVSDLIPQDTTTNSVIKYMEETTFTNNANTVSEGGLKPESALQYTERSVLVEEIATWLPITQQQMDDVPQVQSLINNRLTLMLQQTEETQLLTGNGTSPNLQGMLTKAGIQTQARGADDNQDAIYKAMTLIRVTGRAEPSGIIMHPTNWQAIRLQRTSQGLYIFGNPGEAGVSMLFGKTVIPTDAITLNTALVGSFTQYTNLSRRMGIQLDISNSHDVYFVYNKLAIRIAERLCLQIFRAAALCQCTGLN